VHGRRHQLHALRAEISGAANADWAGVAADLHGRAQSQLESAEHFSDAARRAVRRVGLEGEKAAQPHLGADSGTLRGAAAGVRLWLARRDAGDAALRRARQPGGHCVRDDCVLPVLGWQQRRRDPPVRAGCHAAAIFICELSR